MGELSSAIKNGIIHDIQHIPLKQLGDERGKVMHMLKDARIVSPSIAEVYFSKVYPQCIKAWKKHLRMTQTLSVPVGTLEFIIYDDRADSQTQGVTQTIVLGESAHALLIIPPNLWYGFRTIGDETALVCNCINMQHDEGEVARLPLDNDIIPYRYCV